MQYYNLDTVKAKKRNFLLVFILALIPLTLLAGYRLYSNLTEFAAAVKDGIIPALLAFIFSIFVGTILLIIISTIWISLCCYIPLRRFHDYYCKNIFPLAVVKNSDYFYVQYTDSVQLLNQEELAKANVIQPLTFHKQNKPEYLMGRYKKIDFELTPLNLTYGKNQEIDGSIAVFTGLTALFLNEDFVQISCSPDDDVFAEYLPAKRGLEVKKRISTNNYRKGLITAPKKQRISEEQLVFLEQLMLELFNQVVTCFYVIFSQGRVYFINDDTSIIINLPLWRGIEKEVQDLEKNGIVSISMFINTFIRVTDHNLCSGSSLTNRHCF